ncbi:amidohydrolase [Pseudotabrizicola sp. 4114]|uniref:amidohydrolase family protein n=1 Tax=Pseudotabrizicola sp. 4114 TaxID=2817731 RepID=UPI002855FA50|nr:putative TIM-barrel fold metal-dependent hydrolase [Pseudorhodobacter sp. 4114]
MDLIDTHQHLILRDQLGYGWTSAIPALADRDFSPADYAARTAGKGVIGSLFMETGVDDADYKTEARIIAGLVGPAVAGSGGLLGQVASCRPEHDAAFEAWLDECETLHVKGFRRILHVMEDGLSQSATFRANLRKIGRRGLPFDLCVLARQHDLAEALIKTHDDQIFVLDHCGNPDIAAGAFAPWAASLRRLADFPNLYAKLSGITANCAPGTVSAALLRPYVAHLIDCFGPDRILWGGDWPVVNIHSTLPGWIDLTRDLLGDLSPDEQRAIGVDTARLVYRL